MPPKPLFKYTIEVFNEETKVIDTKEIEGSHITIARDWSFPFVESTLQIWLDVMVVFQWWVSNVISLDAAAL